MRRYIAMVTAFSLLAAPMTTLLRAQGPKPTASNASVSKPATATVAQDGGWPRAYTTPAGAALVIYQPQVASWQDERHAVLYAAVSYAPAGTPQPLFGTLKIESDTSVAVDQRLVSFSELQITESNFPKLSRDQIRDLIGEINTSVPRDERVIALDRVLANIDTSQIIPKNVDGVKADPPTVYFSKTPAVLVNLDSEPIWSPIQGNDLRFAVNTNWDLFEYAPTHTYYVRNVDTWLKAPSVAGPWTYAGFLPDSFFKLPGDLNWNEVKGALPGKRIAASDAPTVFVTTTPAELMLVRGEPKYVPVSATSSLLWVSNTDSDVFRMGRTGPVYYLVAGRWFSAPDFTGPWTFATPHLPGDFKRIPLDHERSRVLASVPGTTQAAEAVLLAQIPQTASVSKSLQGPDVVYQGPPQFEPIPQTSVARAVNTDKDIIKVGDLYYLCFQGVWFMARSASGPWEVTGSVPTQIYQIPASSPAHAVTYVTVQQSNNDAVIFATAMAFAGLMVAYGCVVWGTGYYYPPYVYRGGPYPVYYPHYPTYGYGAAYNPWTGSYARGAVAYGPYGGAGVGAKYNPSTGVYSRGAAAYGPYGGAAAGQAYNSKTGTYARGAMTYGPNGAQGAAQAYNPRTGAYGQTQQGSNVYGNWGSSSVQRGDQWANTAHTTNSTTGARTGVAQTSQGSAVARSGATGNTAVAKSNSGDIYAGRDGNVYKKSGGTWQQSNGSGGWNTVQQPTPQQKQQAQQAGAQARTQASATGATTSQLNSDAAARSAGAQRTSAYSGVQSGQRSSSSYNPTPTRSSGGGASGNARRR